MPISDIYGLRAAIDNIAADPDILDRHEKIAMAARKAVTGAGLKLYLKSGFSSTVTVFEVPEETTADAILDGVKKDYNIMLAGSFDVLAGKVHPHRRYWETMRLSIMYAKFLPLWMELLPSSAFRSKQVWKKFSARA